jgi:hypothetical protein
VLNDSLPASFDFLLNNYSGSESTLDPKNGATLFYESANSGAGKGGVVGCGHDDGRVISLSTFISSVELADADYERLFVNAVEWAAGGPFDNVPSTAAKKLLLKDKGATAPGAPIRSNAPKGSR